MGISARLRYAISWCVINVFMRAMGVVVAIMAWLMMALTMGAYWFSPELYKRDAIRLLEDIDE